MSRELEQTLRAALGGAVPAADPARRDALEAQLVAALPPKLARRRWPKLALGVGLGVAIAAGACALPVDYAASLGHRLAIVVDDDTAVDPEAIVAFVSERYAPDELRMAIAQQRVREQHDDGRVIERGELRIEIDAVGEDLDTDEMWHELVEAFPALDGGRLEDEALRSTVHGTLGGRLSLAWLDVTLDRHGVEEAKAQILLQLEAEGHHGAVVDIVDGPDPAGGHRREVRVHLEDER